MKRLLVLVLLIVVLSACTAPEPEVIVVTATSEPTVVPTTTTAPTMTVVPTSTPVPQMSDDFCYLNWEISLEYMTGTTESFLSRGQIITFTDNMADWPNAEGSALDAAQQCLNRGWTGWRVVLIGK